MTSTPRTILDGLVFPEGARWHDGALFFSDMHDGVVWRMTPEGVAERILTLATQPSGLGWGTDGALRVVSMFDRLLLRVTPAGTDVVADLSTLSPYVINDMVIDRLGRAYIGTFGCDLNAGDPPVPTQLFCAHPDGTVEVAADGIMFPNGAVITPDDRTLIIAETFGKCLSAFDVRADGALANRRLFASLDAMPDGICLDADGGVWVAALGAESAIRVVEGGAVTDTIPLPGRDAFSCTLGGADRRDLYICTARDYNPEVTKVQRGGRIEVVRVAVPGAGLP